MLTWLADVLRTAGLTVVEVDGWETRGRPGPFEPIKGILLHHTAGPAEGNMPSLELIAHTGRPDLHAPLANLGLGRDGTYYVIAAGRANHAGLGAWKDIPEGDGNTHFIGIEAENKGDGTDPWPDVQMDAYHKGVAAMLAHLGLTSDYAVGHREFALPAGRKIDPNFDMVQFRAVVDALMNPQEGSPASAEDANPQGGPDAQPGSGD